jgi:hypothetical protein
MDGTVNAQGTNQEADVKETETKTFTQEEVNQIVSERVKKERAKFEGFDDLKAKAAKFDELEEAQKSELQKAQERAEELERKLKAIEHEKGVQSVRAKVAQEKGIPAELLTGETEEACISQADKILTFAQSNGYPAVKDSGEVGKTGKATARDQFDQWAKKVL